MNALITLDESDIEEVYEVELEKGNKIITWNILIMVCALAIKRP